MVTFDGDRVIAFRPLLDFTFRRFENSRNVGVPFLIFVPRTV